MTDGPGFEPLGWAKPDRLAGKFVLEPQEQEPPVDVFISCSAEDRPWEEWISSTLRRDGYSILDAGLLMGSRSVSMGLAVLKRSPLFLVVLSPSYIHSPNSNREWQAAWAQDPITAPNRIAALAVSPTEPPGLLGTAKIVPLFGVSEATARRRLLSLVRQIIPSRGRHRPVFPGNRQDDLTMDLDALPRSSRFEGRDLELMQLDLLFWDSKEDRRVVGIVGPPARARPPSRLRTPHATATATLGCSSSERVTAKPR